MLRDFNIAISGKFWSEWGGGIDLLRVIISALLAKEKYKNKRVKVFVFLPQRITGFIALLKDILKMRKICYLRELKIRRDKKKFFDDVFGLDVQYVFYNDTTTHPWEIKCKDFFCKLKKYKIDVVLPMHVPLDGCFSIPWIGYVTDFCNYYYPENTDEKNRAKKHGNYIELFDESKAILVNSKFVEKEAKKFYPKTKSQFFCMPFAPLVRKKWLTDSKLVDIINRYNLPEKYFLISNNFHLHDRHITAFKAFSMFIKSDVYLVCTGDMNNEPDYFKQLMNSAKELGIMGKLIILGFIPKFDQIQIMRNCIAVIQPTLSEGGPGGGCIYDSVSLGVRSIVSDIPVNLELGEEETVTFFKADCAEALCDKMNEVLSKPFAKAPMNKLIENSDKRLKFLSAILFTAIDFTCNGWNRNDVK